MNNQSIIKLLFVVLMMFSSVAFAKDAPIQPSVPIYASMDAVKSAVVRVSSLSGLSIDSDTSYQMTLSQPIKTGLGLVMLRGKGARARQTIQFTFFKSGDAIMITGLAETLIESERGVEHEPLNSKKDLQEMQFILFKIKAMAEGDK